MKLKPRRAPRVIVASVAQGRAILRGCWALFLRQRPLALAVLVAAAIIGSIVHPSDPVLLAALHFWNREQENVAYQTAWYLGTWGDYPTYNVPLVLALWLYGVVTRSRSWRRIAMICFLGATLAGLFDDFFRLTLGRPRPDTHMPDGFYGPAYAFSGGYQSFPSGHAAAVFGAATALLVADLPLGLVTTLFGFGVVWARMELYRHYPSDIAVGSIIGIYFGLLVGFGAKQRRTLPARPLDSRASSH